MDFLLKAILFSLFLCFHCTNGHVYGRHEIVRRDLNMTEEDQGLRGVLSMILKPLASFADKVKDSPLVSHYRKHFN
ncbi:uncharacterized protein LOC122617031 [Drosophila teissieri]|uniref:uncharacterized protein LOC122617031 n=1 Tax=Drosophila teissieri TaxID=7243 RepID=UPI001CBA4976|nr:uncharacterized protein LOC122617031 [Drosophila teissieri]